MSDSIRVDAKQPAWRCAIRRPKAIGYLRGPAIARFVFVLKTPVKFKEHHAEQVLASRRASLLSKVRSGTIADPGPSSGPEGSACDSKEDGEWRSGDGSESGTGATLESCSQRNALICYRR